MTIQKEKLDKLRLLANELENQINDTIEKFEQDNTLIVLHRIEDRKIKIGLAVELSEFYG